MQDPRDDHRFPIGSALTRRTLLQTLAAAAAPLAFGARVQAAQAAQAQPPGGDIGPLNPSVLPPGVRSRFVDGVNGLRMHVLEAGFETPGRPALLLVHGLPRARLQLAQGDGAARRGRLSRVRAGRARLRAHVAGTESTTPTTSGRSAR